MSSSSNRLHQYPRLHLQSTHPHLRLARWISHLRRSPNLRRRRLQSRSLPTSLTRRLRRRLLSLSPYRRPTSQTTFQSRRPHEAKSRRNRLSLLLSRLWVRLRSSIRPNRAPLQSRNRSACTRQSPFQPLRLHPPQLLSKKLPRPHLRHRPLSLPPCWVTATPLARSLPASPPPKLSSQSSRSTSGIRLLAPACSRRHARLPALSDTRVHGLRRARHDARARPGRVTRRRDLSRVTGRLLPKQGGRSSASPPRLLCSMVTTHRSPPSLHLARRSMTA